MIIRISLTYNAILGRSGLNALRAVVSTYHLLIQFLIRNEIGEMHGDQQLARHCFMVSVKNSQLEDSLSVDKLNQKKMMKGMNQLNN